MAMYGPDRAAREAFEADLLPAIEAIETAPGGLDIVRWSGDDLAGFDSEAELETAFPDQLPGPANGTISGAVQRLLEAPSVVALQALILARGLPALEAWVSDERGQNYLVHELACRELPHLLLTWAQQGGDLDRPRCSDGNTAFHLSYWYDKKLSQQCLEGLSDSSIQNHYGETPYDLRESALGRRDHIIWLDLELTALPRPGRDPEILEIAIILTDKDLKKLAREEWVIHHDMNKLNALSNWQRRHFCDPPEGNGLFAACETSPLTLEQAEQAVLQFLKEHQLCNNRLGGNSVHCDRDVLKKQMPEVWRRISHQVLDVSTPLNLLRLWDPANYLAIQALSNRSCHRAMADVEMSIGLAAALRQRVFSPQPPSPRAALSLRAIGLVVVAFLLLRRGRGVANL